MFSNNKFHFPHVSLVTKLMQISLNLLCHLVCIHYFLHLFVTSQPFNWFTVSSKIIYVDEESGAVECHPSISPGPLCSAWGSSTMESPPHPPYLEQQCWLAGTSSFRIHTSNHNQSTNHYLFLSMQCPPKELLWVDNKLKPK